MLLRIVDRQMLEFESVAAINDSQRDLHLEIEALEPGEYHIFAELDWNKMSSEAPKFQITAYGQANCEFLGDEHNLISKEDLLCSIIRTKVMQGHPSLTVKNMAGSH
jgi:hypothetical protein